MIRSDDWCVSLEHRCLQVIADNFGLLETKAFNLPPTFKNDLLQYLLKRGLVSDANIGNLVNYHTHDLDLTESEISDKGLSLISVCEYLTDLNLNSCKGYRTTVSSEGLSSLVTHVPRLLQLQLRRCRYVDDRFIDQLTTHCPHLRVLNLGGCGAVGDMALFHITRRLCHLRSLDVSATAITDAGLQSFSECRGRLVLLEIKLNNNDGVTDLGISSLLSHCPNLKIVILHGCRGVTEQSRQLLGQGDRQTTMHQLTWTIY